MDRILLFLEHRENRHLLAEYLGRQYEVIQAEGKQDLNSPFDLGILDGLALDRIFEAVKARKEAEQPVFLPFLLVASRPDVGMVTRYLWRTVDELILTPIVPVELQARVEILLRARRLSQESEARYYALAENSPAGIFIVQDERIVYANPSLREIIGRPDEESVSLHFTDFIYPDDRGKILACYQGLAAGKAAPEYCEIRLMTPQGVRWIEFRASAITYRGSFAILGIALDFTERKRAAEDLEKYRYHLEELVNDRTAQLTKVNEQLQQEIGERKQAEVAAQSAYTQLNQIFDAAGDGMCVLDREFRVVRLNQTLCTLLGLSREEVLGKHCYEIFGSSLCGTPMCPTTRILSGEKRVECDIELSRRDGVKIPCILTATPLGGVDGQVIGIVENFKDITERKKIEEELQKTQRLESLGLLAGGIAHDFNNILTVLGGGISMVRQQVQPESEDSQILARAEEESLSQGKRLTRQLLTFAKGGSPRKKPALISELLRNATSFSLSGSKARSEFFLPEDLWPVEIDEGQISQVIHNIMINADQAMPGGGLIRVWAENVMVRPKAGLPLEEGKYVKISIKDQGSGIPPEFLPKIFDPYFTTKSGGSGLGLAIAYSIMKRHGGSVAAESEPGAGTTFSLYLPASGKKPDVREKEEREEKKERPIHGQGRILFMDDEQTLRAVAGRMLNYLGYDVEFACDGDEAIRLYQKARETEQSFDCVILDLTIAGGMGGEETIQKLREIDPGVKAIVSSGYSNAPIMATYSKYGFREVIAKPYNIQELSEKLHKVMRFRPN